MKKVTLSAAILALSMMGCSDVGLDNSVASAPASEVKSEQSGNHLAKSIYYNWGSTYTYLFNMDPENPYNDGYGFFATEEAGIGFSVKTIIDQDWDGTEAQGEFIIHGAPFAPRTFFAATGLFSDCSYNEPYYTTANCKGFANVDYVYDPQNVNKLSAVVTSPRNPRGQKLANDKLSGAVSVFVGVWNQNSPYELPLKGATYRGPIFDGANGAKKALAIYRKYIWPVVREKLLYD